MLRSLALLCPALLPGAGATLLRTHAAQRVEPTIRGGWPEECVSERERLELDRRIGGARLLSAEAGARADQATNISKGDTYFGWMQGCAKGKPTAMRVEVDTWPSSAKVDFFPLAYYDNHERAFVKPRHDLSGEWQVTGDQQKDGVHFAPAGPVVAGSAGKEFQFSLKVEGEGMSGITGDIVYPGHKGHFSPTESELRDMPFFCQGFSLSKCSHAPPRPDEKVVVFMRHASAACNVNGGDPTINAIGEDQVADRMSDPNLAKMLSADPEESAQVIMMSPMVRTMHTALLAFRKRLPKAKWELDANLIELGGIGMIVSAAGEAILSKFNADELLEQYLVLEKVAEQARTNRDDPRHHHKHKEQHHNHSQGAVDLQRREGLDSAWLQNVERAMEAESAAQSSADTEAMGEDLDGPELDDRFERFTQRVWNRPEKRFIAVSHKHILKEGLGVPLDQTQTVIMALSEHGWRRLEPTQCWPGFHL